MFKHSLLACALGLALPGLAQAQAQPQACQQVTEKDIEALFVRWNDDLQSGDPQKVVENYAEQSLLLPTLSNTPRETAQAKADYFQHFLAGKPDGAVDSRMIQIDCNTAVDAGLYTFSYADGRRVQARYTFTYKWFPKQEQWLITSHHSSAMPEPQQAQR